VTSFMADHVSPIGFHRVDHRFQLFHDASICGGIARGLRLVGTDAPISQESVVSSGDCVVHADWWKPAPIPIWVGGSSEAVLARAVKCDGWHGSRQPPDKAAPIIRRLREARPAPFAISLRSGWDGKDAGGLAARLSAYRDVGTDHVLVEPGDREIDDWLRSVEKIAKAGGV
jgi:hypothetical protein